MPQISYSGAFNAATEVVPDLYLNIQTPGQGVIMPAPFGLVGVEGVASWGPVNKTTLIGSTSQFALYGNPVNRSSDLVTAATIVAQAQQAAGLGANMLFNRVTDGTDTAASGSVGSTPASTETATIGGTLTIGDTLHVTLTSTGITGSPVTATYTTKANDTPATMAAGLAAAINANTNLQASSVSATSSGAVVNTVYPSAITITFAENVTGTATETITLAAGSATTIIGLDITSMYTGSLGNGETLTIAAGSNSTTAVPTWRATVQMPGFPSEIFDNLGAGLTGKALWQAIASAINNGTSPLRGPSKLAVASAGGSTATPTATTVTLSGGTDGAGNVTSADFIGTDTAPRTGIYAFRSSGCTDMFIADFDDITQETDLIAFGQSEGIYVHSNGAPGETPTAAQTNKQTQGSFGNSAAWLKRYLGDWVYWNDNYNGVQRLIGPATFGVALISTLQPQQNSLNKGTTGVVATQRSRSGIPYGEDELAVLTSSGIDVICNPIPAGSQFGMRIGVNASANAAIQGDEWPRLTGFLARSLSGPGALGTLIGLEITDTYYTDATALLDAFFEPMTTAEGGNAQMIQAFQVSFPSQGNQSQTAKGIVICQVLVQFLGIARIFLVNMQTGATVVIPANGNVGSAAAALAAA